jgi:hypothetical protein
MASWTPEIGDRMHQQEFEEITSNRMAAIEAARSAPDIRVEHCSDQFRAAWEISHAG